MLENKMLRGTFGSKGEEVTADCRELHNEEIHNLYSALNIVRGRNQGDEMRKTCIALAKYVK
jgi:hypothetical protein